MTLTPASVQIRFNHLPLLPVVLNFRKMLPLGTEGHRETISEVKGDKLRQPRFVAMWQITAFVPAAKTVLGILNLW